MTEPHTADLQPIREPLSRLRKISYGVGDLGINLADTMVSVLFAIFLTDIVGMRPGHAAIAVFLGRISDWISDPIIGYLSDRTRTRWGRRRPYLLFGSIPFAIVYSMLWYRPGFTSATAMIVYYAVLMTLYGASSTAIYMPYFALTPEIASGYDEQTSLTSYRMAFSIIGGMIGFTVPLALIGELSAANAPRVLAVGTGMAVLSVLPVLVTFFGTRERAEFQKLEKPTLGESLRAVAGNRMFYFVAGIFLFAWIPLDIVQAVLLYYLKHRMHMEQHGDVLFAMLFVFALLSIPVWEAVSRKYSKKHAYAIGVGFLALVLLYLGFGVQPGQGLPVLLVVNALAGIGFGSVQVLTWSMIPDVVEWDEYRTGSRHEGMYYSAINLLRKVAVSLALPAILIFLDVAGYNGSTDVQAPQVTVAIQLLMGLVPAILLGIGFTLAFVYPMDRTTYNKMRTEMERRRAGTPE